MKQFNPAELGTFLPYRSLAVRPAGYVAGTRATARKSEMYFLGNEKTCHWCGIVPGMRS